MSDFPRIDLTVDAVVFGYDKQGLSVILIQRKHEPFVGQWAFPGGFIDEGEHPDDAVDRELKEETGVEAKGLTQFHTFADPDRDPRKRIASIAYYTIVKKADHNPVADDDAENAEWHTISNLPELAFDHQEMYERAAKALKNKIFVRGMLEGFDIFESNHILELLG